MAWPADRWKAQRRWAQLAAIYAAAPPAVQGRIVARWRAVPLSDADIARITSLVDWPVFLDKGVASHG